MDVAWAEGTAHSSLTKQETDSKLRGKGEIHLEVMTLREPDLQNFIKTVI